MTVDFSTLVAIIAMAAATVLTRLSGLVLVWHVSFEKSRRKVIESIPPAVLMAVVAPTAFATGIAESIACAVTAIAALRLPMLVSVALGVLCVALLRAATGE
ncbi:branched-chain amino acid transporter AzlD family protein [Rhizobium etli 8C-3]|uniref:Branched-chain amino acid transporter AzlD family protein n=2 Tax=Rhizobium TaxID=379 RepID=A0A1L5P663_RHIET|nr:MULTISPECIES: AzlD domain-containing protein [Rhizobium]APO75644.1 branched-chain amino acid transporter AzlD family protein [Rhizobium etli 8C-3]TCU21874.1 putative membrane protein [Rhizobium azibense]TCU33323.1 putative membrane protein [Rhizobium azibense]